MQACQSALRMPEEVVNSLSICRTALNLQQEASQLQHTAIQQCNILQVWDNTEEIKLQFSCFCSVCSKCISSSLDLYVEQELVRIKYAWVL